MQLGHLGKIIYFTWMVDDSKSWALKEFKNSNLGDMRPMKQGPEKFSQVY